MAHASASLTTAVQSLSGSCNLSTDIQTLSSRRKAINRGRSARSVRCNLGEQEPKWKPDGDWDHAWAAFKKQQKQQKRHKGPFASMEQYVSRNPSMSNYPLSEETDPIRVSERVALDVWSNPNFAYAGMSVLVGFLVLMVVVVGPPPA